MALTPDDKTRLYSDAFANNAKAMLGESGFAALDLKTSLDVARMELGVAQDEIRALYAERDKLSIDLAEMRETRDELALKIVATSERSPMEEAEVRSLRRPKT